MAYKADVADLRESPSLEVLRRLRARGGDVVYCDPHFKTIELDGDLYAGIPFSVEAIEAADCVVMLTQHREFMREPWSQRARLVVDTRHVVPAAPHVRSI